MCRGVDHEEKIRKFKQMKMLKNLQISHLIIKKNVKQILLLKRK